MISIWGLIAPAASSPDAGRQLPSAPPAALPQRRADAKATASAALLRPNCVVTLDHADAPTLQLAADCFGRSMSADPLLTWVTDGSCPDRVARFFSNVAHMALQAAPDRSTCWALQQSTTSPPDTDTDTDTDTGSESAPESLATVSSPAAAVAPGVVCMAFEYPRSYPSDWAWASRGLFRTLLSAPSLRAARAFLKTIMTFAKDKERFYKAHGPFLYICCFGTAPEFQGKGLGSELMREVLAHAARLGVPAYLEASGVDSCRFYQRHGFQILQEFRVAPGAPALFRMANFRISASATTTTTTTTDTTTTTTTSNTSNTTATDTR
ncbi:hypothetical protein PLESTB_000214000 [Pleodorina starrii]|uniref:N-acetyltransferase domain-containing protein n=1 Tax=Pleodorina starrii TaxID=330485 RepID=A0A9W6BCT9_9CHLO|nr:hypothetical protein PLESTM_001539700 [Pleodorina starrii]GLC49388.1 hypothetical protein PLESTB_000214000 [Pleodorina starrii]GLC73350.1 hypothetical protein PLESTF_001366000 [Pleodorina starrii]